MYYCKPLSLELSEDNLKSLRKFKDFAQSDSLVFFDLETSGLSPIIHEIIEIAGVKFDGSSKAKLFHSLVKPKNSLTEDNMAVHGIRNEDLANAPDLTSVLKEFLNFIGEAPLIAHNAQFDIGFLISDIWKKKFEIKNNDVFDSCLIARIGHKNLQHRPENHKLSTLASFYSIQFDHHRATEDTIATIQVTAEALKNIFNGTEIQSSLNKAKLFHLAELKEKRSNLPNHLAKLNDAILKKKNISIVYQGGSKGLTPRPITPVAILPLPQGLILQAHCLTDNTSKAFKINKIKKILDE